MSSEEEISNEVDSVVKQEEAMQQVVEESKTFRATFVSTISKFSAKNARLGIAIPAKIRSQFPVGITVAVTVQEIKEGQVQQ